MIRGWRAGSGLQAASQGPARTAKGRLPRCAARTRAVRIGRSWRAHCGSNL